MILIVDFDQKTGRILAVTTGQTETIVGHLDDTSKLWLERDDWIDPRSYTVDLETFELVQVAASGPPPVDLEEVRAKLLAAVDEQAEQARLLYITPGYGQALEYEQTEREALLFQAKGGEADLYPMLGAELEARQATGEPGLTLAVVAGEIVAQSASWRAAAATIKRLRRQHKILLNQATTLDELGAASFVPWPRP